MPVGTKKKKKENNTEKAGRAGLVGACVVSPEPLGTTGGPSVIVPA